MCESRTVELASVPKRSSETRAAGAIDLKIGAGRYCCLLRPSGCGKTSTLRMIASRGSVTDGDIVIGARRVNDDPPDRSGTARMFRDCALCPHLDVAKSGAFSLASRPEDAHELAPEA